MMYLHIMCHQFDLSISASIDGRSKRIILSERQFICPGSKIMFLKYTNVMQKENIDHGA